MSDFYTLEARSLRGETIPMSRYAGKVVLVVNTASKCGFTPQYEGLEALYRRHEADGLVILGFPCNQFGQQEPGDADEIEGQCLVNYGVSFPMFEKIDVNGKNASDLFKFLKKEKKSALGSSIKWNFTKFLIDREGNVVKRFAPTDTPESIEQDIVALL